MIDKTLQTLQDYIDRYVLDVIYDFGMRPDEAVEAGLLAPEEVTQTLRDLDAAAHRFDSIYDSDDAYDEEL